jgi:hypothetical protein
VASARTASGSRVRLGAGSQVWALAAGGPWWLGWAASQAVRGKSKEEADWAEPADSRKYGPKPV